ncbi:MAG: permease [Ignavibacteria bacterium]|nr:permease [Ignavibacteria bacterium]
MDWRKEGKILLFIGLVFLGFYFLPIGEHRFDNAVFEALYLAKWYAREHVIFCLIPAFFIAGAIGVFISQQSVMKYLGAKANKVLAYGVASVSGSILAVCSCTVLPLFAGIYRMGAGIGPATAFLYSGPAINVLAIILTAKILGVELGIARAIGAVVFSIVIGLIMHLIFRKEEEEKAIQQAELPQPEIKHRLYQNVIYFGLMIAILVFANWGKATPDERFFYFIFENKWWITSIFSALFAFVLVIWFEVKLNKIIAVAIPIIALSFIFYGNPLIPFLAGIIALTYLTKTSNDEMQDWLYQTWDFTKQITPLLLWGVLIAGFALGRPGNEGIIPSQWISSLVGGNSLGANFFSSLVGAFMYFATLTEVPIVQGLLGSGMGKGPALALLLAGPALSLPNMLVIKSIMGTKKTIIFVSLVVVLSTITGYIFGLFY